MSRFGELLWVILLEYSSARTMQDQLSPDFLRRFFLDDAHHYLSQLNLPSLPADAPPSPPSEMNTPPIPHEIPPSRPEELPPTVVELQLEPDCLSA